MSIGENMCQAFQKEKVSVSASKVRFAQDKQAAVNQTSPKNKGEEPFFYRGKENVGRGCFEQKFIGGKWELGVVVAFHWLQVRAAAVAGPAGLCHLQGMVQMWGSPFLAP